MGSLADMNVGKVVKRSDDGRNIMRSHKVSVSSAHIFVLPPGTKDSSRVEGIYNRCGVMTHDAASV
jgi:hypothetical protein